MDKEAEVFPQQIDAWLTAFVASEQHAGLTPIQQRGCQEIVHVFVQMMAVMQERPEKKWTAPAVERGCLEILGSGVVKESLCFALPPVLVAFLSFLHHTRRIANAMPLIRAVHRAQERSQRSSGSRQKRSHADAATVPPLLPDNPDSQGWLRRFAAQIAQEIAKDRPAMISREAMEGFERQPILVFDLLELLVEDFTAPESPDDYRVTAYFMLLAHALRNIRFGMERRFAWAIELDQEFQTMVVKRARADSLPPQLLAGILESVTEARLEPSRELLEVYEHQIMHHAPRDEMPTRGQIDAMFENLVDEHGGDPFAIGETLAQMTRALPLDAQSALIGEFACSNLPGMKDAVVILCLHGEETVRREALEWLLKNARFVTPTALRRLIVIRNWLPDRERKLLDSLIKNARIKGVECARWSDGLPVQGLHSSRMDGVGTLSLLLSMPVKPGKARIGGVLLKQQVGVTDAWLTPPITRSEAQTTFRQVGQQEFFLEVSQDFLNAAIRHHLAVGLEGGHPPSVGLLQLAETVMATSWVPERLDGRLLVERLIDTERGQAEDAGAVERIVHSGESWSEMTRITGSWFEESQEVVDFMESTRLRGRERLLRRVLELFCEPNREVWAERCAWTAFWLREQKARVRRMEGLDLHFAILARELYRGRPLHELPLMRRIAERTMGGEG
ncbi:MAG: hypothetical protein HQL95_13680 [Magnetococcales bacterium]|nr:hypothetical protein [Magnetococcales bacterium]